MKTIIISKGRRLLMMLAVIILLGIPSNVNAAKKVATPVKIPTVSSLQCIIINNTYGEKEYCSFWTGNKGDVIVSMASSNPGVASLTKKNLVIRGLVKKAGRTVFTVKVKRSGKVYTLKQELRAYAYKPFKTLKIGNGMNYAANINYDKYAISEEYGTKARLQVVLNEGWTLKQMQYFYPDGSYKNIKTGKLINVCEEGGSIKIKVYHTMTNTTSICYLEW